MTVRARFEGADAGQIGDSGAEELAGDRFRATRKADGLIDAQLPLEAGNDVGAVFDLGNIGVEGMFVGRHDGSFRCRPV